MNSETIIKNNIFNKSSEKPLSIKEKIALKIIKRKLNKKNKKLNPEGEKRVIDQFAFWGFIAGLLPVAILFVLPALNVFGFLANVLTISLLFLPLIAIVFSLIGLRRIHVDSENRKGRVFSIIGLLSGLISLGFLIYIISIIF